MGSPFLQGRGFSEPSPKRYQLLSASHLHGEIQHNKNITVRSKAQNVPKLTDAVRLHAAPRQVGEAGAGGGALQQVPLLALEENDASHLFQQETQHRTCHCNVLIIQKHSYSFHLYTEKMICPLSALTPLPESSAKTSLRAPGNLLPLAVLRVTLFSDKEGCYIL